MRRIMALATVFCALFWIGPPLAPAQKLPPVNEKTPQPLSTASGRIRVIGNPGPLMDYQLILQYVTDEPSFKKEAIHFVSPEAAKSGEEVANVSWGGVNERVSPPPGMVDFYVEVKSFDKRVPAGDLLTRLAMTLHTRLPELDALHQLDIARYRTLRERHELLAGQLETQKNELYAIQRMQESAVSADDAEQRRARFDAQIEAISAELEGLAARRETLEKLIAEVGKRGAEAVENDPVIAELEKAAALRAEIVKRMRANKSSADEILTAESQLAEHKAELAKMRRDVAQLAGGQRVAELVRRLEDASVEQAEATARSRALEKMRDSITISIDLEMRRLKLTETESSYRDLSREVDEFQRKVEAYTRAGVILQLPSGETSRWL